MTLTPEQEARTHIDVALQDGGWIVQDRAEDLDATAYGIADNRTGEIVGWDQDALRGLLSVLQAEDAWRASATRTLRSRPCSPRPRTGTRRARPSSSPSCSRPGSGSAAPSRST